MIFPERPLDGRVLGGVCLGVAHAWSVDVTLIRFAFLALTLAWGLGIVLYLSAWLLMPTAGARRSDGLGATAARNVSEVRRDIASSARRMSAAWTRGGRRTWPPSSDRRRLGAILVTTGALVLLVSLGAFAWVTPTRAAGLGVIAVGISLLMSWS
jgi:phage shock protein C